MSEVARLRGISAYDVLAADMIAEFNERKK